MKRRLRHEIDSRPPCADAQKGSTMPEEIYSPGLEGVIAGETAISTIAGGLQYRGYSIEDLAAHATFAEVAYLVLHGELPNAAELSAFRDRLAAAATVPSPIIDVLRKIPAQ